MLTEQWSSANDRGDTLVTLEGGQAGIGDTVRLTGLGDFIIV